VREKQDIARSGDIFNFTAILNDFSPVSGQKARPKSSYFCPSLKLYRLTEKTEFLSGTSTSQR
jgi:hypothetical protein